MDNQTSQYIPGICNIGPAEIARRKMIGHAGTIITVVAWVILGGINLSHYWRLLLFFPATLAAIGYVQARLHFCANFGLKGIFNFRSDVDKHDTVVGAEFRKQDRRKGIEIIIYSMAVGVLVAIVAYYL